MLILHCSWYFFMFIYIFLFMLMLFSSCWCYFLRVHIIVFMFMLFSLCLRFLPNSDWLFMISLWLIMLIDCHLTNLYIECFYWFIDWMLWLHEYYFYIDYYFDCFSTVDSIISILDYCATLYNIDIIYQYITVYTVKGIYLRCSIVIFSFFEIYLQALQIYIYIYIW